MLRLIITYSLLAACTWMVMTYRYGPPTRQQCRQLRANGGPGDNIGYHQVEQNTNLSLAMVVNFTKLDNEPPFAGIADHYRYRVNVKLNDANGQVSLAGWMFQMRDNGSQGADYQALLDGTIRGQTMNLSDCSTSELWTCPARFNGELIDANGVVHGDGTYNIAASTSFINEVEFEWAPVRRNETGENAAYVKDPPKCGKLVGTVMLRNSNLLWWHALESKCLISNVVAGGSPVECSLDSDC